MRTDYEKLEAKIDKMQVEDIQPMKIKLFNGLSGVPSMMRALLVLFISVLIATAGFGATIIGRLSRVETLLQVHLDATTSTEGPTGVADL